MRTCTITGGAISRIGSSEPPSGSSAPVISTVGPGTTNTSTPCAFCTSRFRSGIALLPMAQARSVRWKVVFTAIARGRVLLAAVDEVEVAQVGVLGQRDHLLAGVREAHRVGEGLAQLRRRRLHGDRGSCTLGSAPASAAPSGRPASGRGAVSARAARSASTGEAPQAACARLARARKKATSGFTYSSPTVTSTWSMSSLLNSFFLASLRRTISSRERLAHPRIREVDVHPLARLRDPRRERCRGRHLALELVAQAHGDQVVAARRDAQAASRTRRR